jgi:hypothetical protein
MKKILLTGCAALLFSIAGLAQQQQQKKTQSSDYRTDKKVEQAADSTYNDADSTLNQGVQRAGQDIENKADETSQDLQQGGERVGNQIDSASQQAGQDIQQGAQKVGDETKEGVQKAGDDMKQGVDRAAGEIDSTQTGTTSSSNKNDNQSTVTATESGEPQPYHDVEVVEDKEGPNGEVVYKFSDGFYYVDREKEKKLVKIEESQLKDIKHKVIVKTAGNTNKSKRKG